MGRVLGYISAAAIIIALLGIVVLLRQPVVRAWPPSLLLFDIIGANVAMPGEGLIIDQLKANAAVGDDGEGTLILRGTIINLKDVDIEVPRVLATLWREDGSTIESWVIDLPYDVLAAEQTFDFEAEYPGVPEEAKSVNLAFAAFMPKKKAAPEPEPEAAAEHEAEHEGDASHEEETHEEPAHEKVIV